MPLVDRVKYDAPTDDVLVWKFPSEELHLGTQLVVNQSQEALFVKGGQVLDVFGPGTHTLSTGNLPLLDKLINFPFGGKTPFTAEVWYVNKIVKRDLKWGTKGPIQVIDATYNFPISVRAFGRWGLKVADSRSFVVQLVGTLNITNAVRIEEYFSGEIVQKCSDALAKYFVEKKESIFQISAKLNDLSSFVLMAISEEFKRFGIEIVNFNIERISIPDEEQKKFQDVFGKRMEIDQIGQSQIKQAYVTMRSFDAIDKAAENEGGSAGNLLAGGLGLGMGLSAGVQAGQQVGQNLNPQGDSSAELKDPKARLAKLKKMLDEGLITKEDFEKKKQEILSSL